MLLLRDALTLSSSLAGFNGAFYLLPRTIGPTTAPVHLDIASPMYWVGVAIWAALYVLWNLYVAGNEDAARFTALPNQRPD